MNFELFEPGCVYSRETGGQFPQSIVIVLEIIEQVEGSALAICLSQSGEIIDFPLNRGIRIKL